MCADGDHCAFREWPELQPYLVLDEIRDSHECHFLILRRLIDNYGQSFNKYIKSLTPISNQRKTKETQKPVKNDVLEMRIKRNEIKSNEMNV